MVSIPLIGVPEYIQDKLRAFGRGTLLDLVWKLLVVAALAGMSLLLIAAGPYGAALGGVLLGTLLSDDVRKLVSDVWNRRWAEVKLPL